MSFERNLTLIVEHLASFEMEARAYDKKTTKE
jgi:hypothetical protein